MGSHTYFKQNGTVLIQGPTTSTDTTSLPQLPQIFQASTISLKVKAALAENLRGNNQIINEKPSYDIDRAAVQITRENTTWNGKNNLGHPATVSYSFDKWNDYNGYDQLTEKQQQQARIALDCWADVANILFVEKKPEEPTDINFGNYYSIKGQAFAYLPNSGERAGQCWFNAQNHPENLSPYPGNYGRLVLAHEIGHSIGLSHPGNYNATSADHPTLSLTWNNEEHLNYWEKAIYAEDDRQYSIMSYWSENLTGANFFGYYASSTLIDDIAAVQKLYGANMHTRTGDTVYGFNSNTDKDWYTINDPRIGIIFCVWDAGGNDTLDFSGYFKNQNINLNAGSFSDVGGRKKNVSIAKNVAIENAIGGSGHDTIIGNGYDNIIKGGAGEDIIFGGLGRDILWGGDGTIRRVNHSPSHHEYSIDNNNQQNSQQGIDIAQVEEYSPSHSGRIEKDTFVYLTFYDSLANRPDMIMDFQTKQDKIDLSNLHRELHVKTNGQYCLAFVREFHGTPGEIKVTYDPTSKISKVFINKDHDAIADFAIEVHGYVDPQTDFIFA